MQLNLPILDHLQDSQNILIAGAGGGFDVFIGLPLYFTLRDLGKTVHLANYTFGDLDLSSKLMGDSHELLPDEVLGVQGKVRIPFIYFPEGYLTEWFQETQNEQVMVWMLAKTGSIPLAEGYQALIQHLNIDAIILVDGGVDSLMRGDESNPGTLVEDTISLAALDMVDVPVKIIACCGFGTEVEEAVCHYQALENMAALAKIGAFWGSCALTPQMPAFQLYESACRYAFEQPSHHKSHISTRIIPAVNGEFGDFHMYEGHTHRIFISPLMTLYWFFDANEVIKRSLLIEAFKKTRTSNDAFNAFLRIHRLHPTRPQKSIPY